MGGRSFGPRDMLRRSDLVSLLFVLLAAAGCTVGPDYLRPADDVPGAFTARPGRVPVLATTAWWLTLDDPMQAFALEVIEI